MARQDGRIPIHFAPDGEVVCMLGRREGVELVISADPHATTCGQCHRVPAWKRAWRDAAKRPVG